jgi:hypothetical protein
MISLKDFKTKAQKKFEKSFRGLSIPFNPIEFAYSLDGNFLSGPLPSAEEEAEMTLALDENCLLGHLAKIAVFLDDHYSEKNFYVAEVCRNLFAEQFIDQAKKQPEKWGELIEKILQFEEPHIVITHQGRQYDPFFKLNAGRDFSELKHPAVREHLLWEGLHMRYLVCEAFLTSEIGSIDLLMALWEIVELYPESLIAQESLGIAQCFLNQFDLAIYSIENATRIRKDARMLCFLWHLTEDSEYREKIISDYSPEMFEYLEAEEENRQLAEEKENISYS